nr:hypothetical protein [Candidatus Baldrarchaeota archaeon]
MVVTFLLLGALCILPLSLTYSKCSAREHVHMRDIPSKSHQKVASIRLNEITNITLNGNATLLINSSTLFLKGTIELWDNSNLTLINVKLFFVYFNLSNVKMSFQQFDYELPTVISMHGNSSLQILNSTVYFLSNSFAGIIYLNNSSSLCIKNSFIGNIIVFGASGSRIFISQTELNGITVVGPSHVSVINSNIGMFNFSGNYSNSTVNLVATYIGGVSLFCARGVLIFRNITVGRLEDIYDSDLFIDGNFTVLKQQNETFWNNSIVKRSYTVLALLNQTILDNVSSYVVNKLTGDTVFNVEVNNGKGRFNLTFSGENFTVNNLLLVMDSNISRKIFDLTFFTKSPLSFDEVDYSPPLINIARIKNGFSHSKTHTTCKELYQKFYVANNTAVYVEWNSNESNFRCRIFLDNKLLTDRVLDNYTFLGLNDGSHLIKIIAEDSCGNSMIFNFILVVDLSPPTILNVFTYPENLTPFSNVRIFVNVSDNYPFLPKAVLSYRESGNMWCNESGTLALFDHNCFVYFFILPKFPHNTTIDFIVKIMDSAGNLAVSKIYSRKVIDPNFEKYIALKKIIETLLQNAKFISPKARKLCQIAEGYYEAAIDKAEEGDFSSAVKYLMEAEKLIRKAYRVEGSFHKELKFALKFLLPILLAVHLLGVFVVIKIKGIRAKITRRY